MCRFEGYFGHILTFAVLGTAVRHLHTHTLSLSLSHAHTQAHTRTRTHTHYAHTHTHTHTHTHAACRDARISDMTLLRVHHYVLRVHHITTGAIPGEDEDDSDPFEILKKIP